ncbi:hypothetical protein [Haladaptatus caseinilyticus]|nr:hypothetical protein [Haladaptatus caseinilyticus]
MSTKTSSELEADDTAQKTDDKTPENCGCDGLDNFPCWECVRTGRKELPN